MIETQDYVLLDERSKSATPHSATPPKTIQSAVIKSVVPDETLLFQYSALGFNSHKIHLDRDHAQQVEGFPDLVVNGGLATLLLTELLRLELNSTFTSLTAKHVAPLFCDRPISLSGQRQNDKWSLQAFDENNVLAVSIQAQL